MRDLLLSGPPGGTILVLSLPGFAILTESDAQARGHSESDDDEELAVLRNLGLLKQAQSPQLNSSDGRSVQACIAAVTHIDSEFDEQRFASPKHSRVLDCFFNGMHRYEFLVRWLNYDCGHDPQRYGVAVPVFTQHQHPSCSAHSLNRRLSLGVAVYGI